MGQQPINAPLAFNLFQRLKSWKEVGKELARQTGREMPFQAESVRAAVKHWQKGNLRCLLKGSKRSARSPK